MSCSTSHRNSFADCLSCSNSYSGTSAEYKKPSKYSTSNRNSFAEWLQEKNCLVDYMSCSTICGNRFYYLHELLNPTEIALLNARTALPTTWTALLTTDYIYKLFHQLPEQLCWMHKVPHLLQEQLCWRHVSTSCRNSSVDYRAATPASALLTT
jgi:hypothetical protein